MLGTLLINQINYRNKKKLRNMFFLIGNMKSMKEKILDTFNEMEGPCSKVTLNYNGVCIHISTEEIPQTVRKLVEIGVDLYGVYEIFEPE